MTDPTSATNSKCRPGFSASDDAMRIGESGGEKRLAHNREPWVRANGPAPTARQIAIAFQKYDATPWMRSSAFPPLQKKSTTESAVHARPESILLFVPYTLLGVRVDALPCSSCCNRLRTNPLILQAACRTCSIIYLPAAAYLNCRPEATSE